MIGSSVGILVEGKKARRVHFLQCLKYNHVITQLRLHISVKYPCADCAQID